MESKCEKKLARLARTYANEKADRVPFRPFAAEFCAQYAGKTCQEVCTSIIRGQIPKRPLKFRKARDFTD